MDFERFVRRYLWDDERTPYLVPVSRLRRAQADHEIFACSLFTGLLFGLVCLVALARGDDGPALLVALYALTVVAAALVFATLKLKIAGYWCAAAAPAALALYLQVGFGGRLDWPDHVLILAVLALWLRYALRVAHLARAYPALART